MLPDENIVKKLYHATYEENANDILKTKKIKIIKQYPNPIHQGKKQSHISGDPGSLGYGFYLFSDKLLANLFRIEKVGKTSNILIFKVNIPKSNLLDFTDEDELKKYNMYKQRISKESAYKERKKAFKNSPSGQSALEGAIIDYYIGFLENTYRNKGKFKKINCVRGFTVTQVKQSHDSYVANGIEYCLKNRDLVEDIEILKEDNNDT